MDGWIEFEIFFTLLRLNMPAGTTVMRQGELEAHDDMPAGFEH